MRRGLSIVIPAYNEERRLPPTLDAVLGWADRTAAFDIELIVVDDGSSDATRDIVREVAARDSRVRLVEEIHVGAVHAICSGFRHARYELVGNMDADCAVHPREFETLLPFIGPDAIAQGSRVLHNGLPKVQNKSRVRRILSFFMYSVFRALFPIGIHDPQIGFRLFPRESALRIIDSLRLRHDGIKHGEIVVRAYGLGMSVAEVPMTYIHDEDSRCVPKSPMKALMTAAAAFFAVLQMWGECSVDFFRGRLSRCPTRFAWLCFPLA